MNLTNKCLFSLLTLIFYAQGVFAQEHILSYKDIFHPVIAKQGMVSSQNHYATRAGVEVLKEGGNAVDAAVTVAFALAVTLPRAGNIGGGGFMVVHLAKDQKTFALDYREKAPFKATRKMFLDESGNADSEKSRYSLQAVGVPGTVAGMAKVLAEHGTISLARALQPAIELAEKGIVVDYDLQQSLKASKARLQFSPAAMQIFFKPNGKSYEVGDVLIQKDLAWSLKQIAAHGPKAFYEGFIAEKLVEFMSENGGLISHADLKAYEAVVRDPIHGTYRGYDVYSMPPPSSGGVHLVQILNILEFYPLRQLGHNTADTLHVMAEAMKYAYADRSKYLGDPDFVDIPIPGLTAKEYAASLQEKIRMERTTPSDKIRPGRPKQYYESNETTHFSVMDQYGNAVSNTYTLNFSYGNKMVVPGTGILLNNQMDDFSAKPGVPNAYGLIGGEHNAIAPGKRMLSSMTPTIVLHQGKPFLVTGSPGGSRIITTTLQVILNVLDHQMNVAEASNAVRVHHQWFPDELRIEKGLNADTIRLLEKKGHRVVVKNAMGSTQSIVWENGLFYGASDPRKMGGLAEGF